MWCKSSTDEAKLLSKCSSGISLYIAVLFLLYLIVYAIACPKRELLVAVGCEISFFVILTVWRITRSRTVGAHAKNAVVDQLTEDIRPLRTARNLYGKIFLAIGVVVCVFGTVDFTSLCLAAAGNMRASAALYTHVPTTKLIGVHTAATAEILAGAFLSAGKLSEAERTYRIIGQVRKSVYGLDSEAFVGLAADYGDLYAVQKRFYEAEFYYKRSIDRSKKINGPTGYGRPLTGLANCYREQGLYEKAEPLYKEALEMRTRLYGPKSDKVAATLKEYGSMLDQMGRKQEAASLLARARSIDALQPKDDNNPYPTMIAMAVIFLGSFFLFGRKGILTKLATERLVTKIRNSQEPQAVDQKRLAVLYKYQGITSDSLQHKNTEELLSSS